MGIIRRLLPLLGVVLWLGASPLWAQEESAEEKQYREDYERYQKISAIKDAMKRADELLSFLRERSKSKLEGNVQSDYLNIVQDLATASKWDSVVSQSERFVKIRPKVGETYWFLGRAFAEMKKTPEAMDALAKCYILRCPVSSKARQYLEYLYKGLRGNLAGLDAIIQKAKAEVGG